MLISQRHEEIQKTFRGVGQDTPVITQAKIDQCGIPDTLIGPGREEDRTWASPLQNSPKHKHASTDVAERHSRPTH